MQALWSSKMIPGGGEIRRLLESSEDSSSGAKYGFTAGFTVAFIAAVVLVCCLMQIVEQYFLQSNHPSAGSSSPALRRIEHVVSLPVRIYDAGPTSSASDTTPSEVEVCAICLGEFEKGESVSVLPLCKHIFHKDCIKQWVPAKSINCPICRSPTVDGDEIPARTTGRVAEMVGADYSMPPLPAFFTLSLSARMTIYSNTGRRL